jgi:hypothetical protein
MQLGMKREYIQNFDVGTSWKPADLLETENYTGQHKTGSKGKYRMEA